MQHSEQFSQAAGALAKAQGAFPVIPRDRTVTVHTKAKEGRPASSYTFKYAPLETILAAVRKPLADNGLALLQSIVLEESGDGKAVEVLRTTLVHETGEWFACDVPMFVGAGDNKAQAYSSGATYARRGGVTMLLCVAADEDDDGNGGEQDKGGPDYERTQGGAEQYRGSFPKQGGGSTAPRAPQRRQAQEAASAVTHARQADLQDGAPFETGEGGEVTSPWGADLSGGQVAMLKAAAFAAGMDEPAVLALTGPVDAASFKDAQTKLKAAVTAHLGG